MIITMHLGFGPILNSANFLCNFTVSLLEFPEKSSTEESRLQASVCVETIKHYIIFIYNVCL